MWSGYSRGSACTWYMFKNDIPYFAYFMPMSCPYMPAGLGAPENSDDTSYEMLKEAVAANADYDFFVFATAGGDNDGAGVMMVDQVKNFLAQEDCFFSYGLDPEVNNFYFTRSAFDHDDCWMPFTLYNALPIIFDGALVREAGAAKEAPVEDAAEEAPAEEAPAEDAAEEAPAEDAAAAEAPEGYTKVKVFDGTYGFGDAEITVAANDDESAFLITFEAFDEDQVLEGTVEDGIVNVEYDETGFMTGDAQLIWDDAVASENAWETID